MKKGTGIIPEELERLGFHWDGNWSLKAPYWGKRHENASISDIYLRIREDISELCARAFANIADSSQIPPHWGNWSSRWVKSFKKEEVENIRKGLWEKLNSNDPLSKKESEALGNFCVEKLRKDSINAADALARLAVHITDELQTLSHFREKLLQEVANTFEQWPVNLGVELKTNRRTKTIEPTVTGKEEAGEYLCRLGVNLPKPVSIADTGKHNDRSLFRFGGESIYGRLNLIKKGPQIYFPAHTKRKGTNISPWGKELLSLSNPMTEENKAKWWNLAKILLDELWREHRESFRPFIEHRGFDFEKGTLSDMRKQVIDDGLKKSFLALARPVPQVES